MSQDVRWADVAKDDKGRLETQARTLFITWRSTGSYKDSLSDSLSTERPPECVFDVWYAMYWSIVDMKRQQDKTWHEYIPGYIQEFIDYFKREGLESRCLVAQMQKIDQDQKTTSPGILEEYKNKFQEQSKAILMPVFEEHPNAWSSKQTISEFFGSEEIVNESDEEAAKKLEQAAKEKKQKEEEEAAAAAAEKKRIEDEEAAKKLEQAAKEKKQKEEEEAAAAAAENGVELVEDEGVMDHSKRMEEIDSIAWTKKDEFSHLPYTTFSLLKIWVAMSFALSGHKDQEWHEEVRVLLEMYCEPFREMTFDWESYNQYGGSYKQYVQDQYYGFTQIPFFSAMVLFDDAKVLHEYAITFSDKIDFIKIIFEEVPWAFNYNDEYETVATWIARQRILSHEGKNGAAVDKQDAEVQADGVDEAVDKQDAEVQADGVEPNAALEAAAPPRFRKNGKNGGPDTQRNGLVPHADYHIVASNTDGIEIGGTQDMKWALENFEIACQKFNRRQKEANQTVLAEIEAMSLQSGRLNHVNPVSAKMNVLVALAGQLGARVGDSVALDVGALYGNNQVQKMPPLMDDLLEHRLAFEQKEFKSVLEKLDGDLRLDADMIRFVIKLMSDVYEKDPTLFNFVTLHRNRPNRDVWSDDKPNIMGIVKKIQHLQGKGNLHPVNPNPNRMNPKPWKPAPNANESDWIKIIEHCEKVRQSLTLKCENGSFWSNDSDATTKFWKEAAVWQNIQIYLQGHHRKQRSWILVLGTSTNRTTIKKLIIDEKRCENFLRNLRNMLSEQINQQYPNLQSSKAEKLEIELKKWSNVFKRTQGLHLDPPAPKFESEEGEREKDRSKKTKDEEKEAQEFLSKNKKGAEVSAQGGAEAAQEGGGEAGGGGGGDAPVESADALNKQAAEEQATAYVDSWRSIMTNATSCIDRFKTMMVSNSDKQTKMVSHLFANALENNEATRNNSFALGDAKVLEICATVVRIQKQVLQIDNQMNKRHVQIHNLQQKKKDLQKKPRKTLVEDTELARIKSQIMALKQEQDSIQRQYPNYTHKFREYFSLNLHRIQYSQTMIFHANYAHNIQSFVNRMVEESTGHPKSEYRHLEGEIARGDTDSAKQARLEELRVQMIKNTQLREKIFEGFGLEKFDWTDDEEIQQEMARAIDDILHSTDIEFGHFLPKRLKKGDTKFKATAAFWNAARAAAEQIRHKRIEGWNVTVLDNGKEVLQNVKPIGWASRMSVSAACAPARFTVALRCDESSM